MYYKGKIFLVYARKAYKRSGNFGTGWGEWSTSRPGSLILEERRPVLIE